MSNSERIHSICDPCWQKREPGQEPVRLISPLLDVCCVCGEYHESGIFFHADPAKLPCRGQHGDEATH